jgi:hypothetical protein
MGLRRDLDDLAKMYSEGGLIVLTLANGENVSPAAPRNDEPYNGRVNDQHGLRTAIQLDGDVVTAVSRDMLYDQDTWHRHMAMVDAKLGVVLSVQNWVRRSWLLFLIIPFGWLLADVLAQDSVLAALAVVRTAALTYIVIELRKQLLTVLRIVLLPLVRRLVGWYMSNQRSKFLSGKAK